MSEGLMNFKKCDEFVAEFEKVIEKPVKSASKVYYTGCTSTLRKRLRVVKAVHVVTYILSVRRREKSIAVRM